MSCNTCKQTVCCCANAPTTVTCKTEKNCLGEEDLCFGFGETKQNRHGHIKTISKINCTTIPCPDGKSVGEHVEAIEKTRHKHYESLAATMLPVKDPNGVTIQMPLALNIGDTVMGADGCVYENKVANNTGRPTPVAVMEGKWLSYCDLKAVIDCVLPSHKSCAIGQDDCAVVVKDKTLCKRTEELEACVFGAAGDEALCDCAICTVVDTGTVNLTKTKLARGNSIKADVILSATAGNTLIKKGDGLYVAGVASTKVADTATVDMAITSGTIKSDVNISNVAGNKVVKKSDGIYVGANDYTPEAILPRGVVSLSNTVLGTFKATATGGRTSTHKADVKIKEFIGGRITLKKSKFSLLAVAGRKFTITGMADIGYTTTVANRGVGGSGSFQWDVVLRVDGAIKKDIGDSYMLARSGDNSGLATSFSVTAVTTGADMVIEMRHALVYTVGGVNSPQPTDTLNVDMATTTIMFAEGDNSGITVTKL